MLITKMLLQKFLSVSNRIKASYRAGGRLYYVICMDFVLMWNKNSVLCQVSIIQDTLFINGFCIW